MKGPAARAIVTACAALLLAGACDDRRAGGADAERAENPPVVRIGSKKFTESVLLAEIAVAALRAHGIPAVHREELGGTRVLWNALREGEIDVYPEYTGTLVQEILRDDGDLDDALAAAGIRMSEPLGFDNGYAIGMRRERAEALDIRTIAELAERTDIALGFTNEFMDRRDGWPGLRAAYGFVHSGVRGLDHDIAYRALSAGELDAIDVYATDAEIEGYDLVLLEDDREFFAEYRALLLWRDDLASRNPAAVEILATLSGTIDAQEMTAMNARAKFDAVPGPTIARRFLSERLGIGTPLQAADGIFGRLMRNTVEHLRLVGISLAAAVALALPLGVAAARHRPTARLVLGTVGVIQTIPALALLVFMIPLLGIGTEPALAALFLYSLLPIVRNTHAGLTDLSPELLEAADAMGLSPRTRLLKIELPLAARTILAGIKTAAIINIGTATLGALIGAGGYGQPILTGIRLDDVSLILQGAVPAALLALSVEGAFGVSERLLVPKGLRHE
jgi:osmoprotectant transport system permease protein